jgi:hypothetical protein
LAWYYCSNGHSKPLMFTSALGAPRCTQCRQPTVAAQGVLRYQKGTDYSVYWHEAGADLVLRVQVGSYGILLADDVLATDTAVFSPGVVIKSPSGGQWFGSLHTYSGGTRHTTESGLISPSLCRPTVKLGQNDEGNAYGLVHILRGHPKMFSNLLTNPPTTFDLTRLRDNLRSITAQPTSGVGVRKVAKQANGRYVIHGIEALSHAHALVIVDGSQNLITTFAGQNMSGLGQNPVPIRSW